MPGDDVRIRLYQAGDLDELHRVCLQTADNGQDATALFRFTMDLKTAKS